MAKEIYLPPAGLETASPVGDQLPDSDPLDGVLTDLCRTEIEYWLDRIGARSEERMIIWLWCRGLSDREIAEGVGRCFVMAAESNTAEAVKKRRQRIIWRINRAAGVDLGLITVLHEAFKGTKR